MAIASEVPLKHRIAASFQQLADGAKRLNKASDELTDAIGPLDAAFTALNLGVTAWYEYAKTEDDFGEFTSRYVGYAKVDGKWGLAISEVSGTRDDSPEEYDDKEWLFNDAPRAMRIDAISHIPSLLDVLVNQVNATASDLEAKTAIARDVAETIHSITNTRRASK